MMSRKNLCHRSRWKRRLRRRRLPPLRLTPFAWAKLLHLRDLGPTEVGGFGVSAPGDLLLVEDVRLVRQQSSAVTVKFDDAAVADYFDACVDQGLVPEQFGRIWIHTHPGNCPLSSSTDEATFDRCFGTTDWAVMFILARGGDTYARLRFRPGPGGDLVLPVEIDYQRPFPASDLAAWRLEYQLAVAIETWPTRAVTRSTGAEADPFLNELDPFLERLTQDESLCGPFREVFDERFA
jgi:hypothetical protein